MMDAAQRKIELWQMTADDDPDLYGVAALLATIPDAVTMVVRFANSSYVGAVYPVSRVLDAVVRVGSRQVGAIALASLSRELIERWDTAVLSEDALACARAARMIGRIMGFPRHASESLFVAGLFSSAGAAALIDDDPAYLSWRSKQWAKGVTEGQLLHRERMAYKIDHVMAAVRQLEDWNMPTTIIDTVSAHHAPRTRFDLALWAGMTVTGPKSPARCHDVPFSASMAEVGLGDHIESVKVEAVRFVEAVYGADDDSVPPVSHGAVPVHVA